MAEPNNLLEIIEDHANRGEPIAVARVLYPKSDKAVSVTASGDEVWPPIADRKLSVSILEAVASLVTKNGVADLIDVVDEEGSAIRLAVEIIKPKLELVVFGAGHVGQAVAMIGALLGYRVTAVDDREEFASRKRLPDPTIELLVSDYANAIGKLTISPSTAVVIVTRGHQYDELCLKNVISSNAGYIGMIGSRRRVVSVFKKLAGEGISEAAFQRVHAPIGLRIGAKSPQEIAVAILAEIIDHVNNSEHKHKSS
jgi:xanthine/CO dehydrogenase XdhC/CoxF family maturation factor